EARLEDAREILVSTLPCRGGGSAWSEAEGRGGVTAPVGVCGPTPPRWPSAIDPPPQGEGGVCQSAATAWNDILAVRAIAPTIAELRHHVVHFVTRFRGAPMPRVWQV